MRRAAFTVAAVVPLQHIFVSAQQVGPNVNVLAGTDPERRRLPAAADRSRHGYFELGTPAICPTI